MLPYDYIAAITLFTSALLVYSVPAEEIDPCHVCEVEVDTDSGPVCGRVKVFGVHHKFYSFQGIPYAKPPLGERRFKIPEPVEPWTDPLFATVEGPSCPQRNLIYGHMPTDINGQSEDCLYINIHIPESANLEDHKRTCDDTAISGLPILFHVPGGGFYCGSGGTDVQGPEYLIKKDVIVVTLNYRLNVFGFLCMKSKNFPCNRGLWDILAALKWVHKNACAFGGDPEKITLMGHSAGAAAAHLLSLSEHAEGLFHNMILMSGTGIPAFYSHTRTYAENTANLLLEQLGLNSTDPDYLYEQLAEIPLNKIMQAHDYVQYQTGIVSFVPTVDLEYQHTPELLTADPITLIAQGREKDLPTLISFTNNEVAYFRWQLLILDYLERLKTTPRKKLIPRLFTTLSEIEMDEAVAKIHQKYFHDGLTFEKMTNYLSDALFKYPALKLAELRAALGGAPVYINEYSYVDSFSLLKYGLWNDHTGACHMEDLSHVFRLNAVLHKYLHLHQSTSDHQMTDWMTNIIINFMRCSNPTCTTDDISPWPPVYPNNYTLQEIETPFVFKTRTLTTEELEMIELFDSIDPAMGELARNL